MAWFTKASHPRACRSMHAACAAAILALFAVPCFSLAQEGEEEENLSGDTPEITFPNLRIDLGDLHRGQRVQRQFTFKNNGKSILEVRSIHSPCGCINTRTDPKTRFAPGEEGRIVFEFDSSWFSGNVVRAITVDSNDPSNSTTVLSVVAHIEEEIRVSPALITLGEIPKETSREYTANIELLGKAKGEENFPSPAALQKIPAESESLKKDILTPAKELKILAAIPSSPHMTVELTSNGEKRQTLKLKFKSALPSGPFRERITLWNTSTHLKELVVPVVGEVVASVKPSTRYLEFGAITNGSRSRRTVSLDSSNADFQVENVAIELRSNESLKGVTGESLISHSIQKSSKNSAISLEMKVPTGLKLAASPLSVSGSIVVRTNDPDHKEIKIPFFGVLQEGEKQ